jgi:ribosome assembly protein YihI (activator of Der GTPase)
MSDSIVDNVIARIDNKLDEIEVLIDQLPLLRDDKSKLIDSIYDFYSDLETAIDRYHEEWQTEKIQGEI